MITVGIHEGLSLGAETKVGEKGELNVHLVKGAAGLGAYDMLESEEPLADEANIKIFIPSGLKYGSATELKETKDLIKDIKHVEAILKGMLRIYLTEDKMKNKIGATVVLTRLGVAKDATAGYLQNEANLQKLYTGMFNDFVKLVQDNKLNESKASFRLKLVRQSKKSHWPTFPKGLFDPWIETMEISETESKVKFTDYEIKNNLNDPFPASSDIPAPAETATAETLFEEDTKNEDIPDMFPDDSMN